MLTNEQRDHLIQAALNVRRWAYVPYSHYSVGAALLTSSGKIYDGCNIENAAYSVTVCAERVAVFKAVSEGEQQIEAVAIVTEKGNAPCGSCRQVLNEFGPDCLVICANLRGDRRVATLAALLPDAFGPW